LGMALTKWTVCTDETGGLFATIFSGFFSPSSAI